MASPPWGAAHVMDRETWIELFAVVLVELRPHFSAIMAHRVGTQEYTAENTNPKGTARVSRQARRHAASSQAHLMPMLAVCCGVAVGVAQGQS